MAKKRLDKKIPALEANFREILVCKPKNAKPYMEVFVCEPENVFQQNLGTLFGVLEINDDSPDSSYVVNYLISVIKKEFFSNVKRGTIESFEAALHKANLALSKLAEHEHISWIGKINAICAVAEKNNIHLTGTGTACALLLRSKALVNISEGGEEETEGPNPCKTFQEVVSGRLEDGDKIIIATNEIFDIFSLEEIKRSAIKFSREEFHRFLNTALVNELERAAVLITDISEKAEPEMETSPIRKSPKLNAFSQSAFARGSEKQEDLSRKTEEKNALMDELKRELEKTREGYTDEKTGHIYIKDDGLPSERQSSIKDYSKDIFGRMKNMGQSPFGKIKRDARVKKSIPEESEERYEPVNIPAPRKEMLSEVWLKIKIFFEKFIAFLPVAGAKIISFLKTASFYTWSFIINRVYIPLKKLAIIIISFIKSRLERKKEVQEDAVPRFNDYSEEPEMLSPTRQEKRDWFNALSNNENVSQPEASFPIARERYVEYPEPPKSKKILPSFGKIQGIFSRFSRKEKIYAGFIIAVLIIVPYFIAKAIDKSKAQKAPTVTESIPAPLPLENDKNVFRITSMENVLSGNYGKIVDVNGKIFALKENAVVALEDQKEYNIPEEFKNPDLLFAMDDLNLIFLYKDGKITSISATSRKYQNNNISVPNGAKIASGASFLTYGYLLDSANNQIYRYPRAEGGFGEKANWIKDNVDFSEAKDMAINENVYVADGKGIFKFYRGKKQDFNLENTATPFSVDQIYTRPDYQNLYILDKNNSRIIKLDASGNILSQYYSPEIAKASDFAADEESQKIYISSENGVSNFQMN